jgi:hypothetical protein
MSPRRKPRSRVTSTKRRAMGFYSRLDLLPSAARGCALGRCAACGLAPGQIAGGCILGQIRPPEWAGRYQAALAREGYLWVPGAWLLLGWGSGATAPCLSVPSWPHIGRLLLIWSRTALASGDLAWALSSFSQGYPSQWAQFFTFFSRPHSLTSHCSQNQTTLPSRATHPSQSMSSGLRTVSSVDHDSAISFRWPSSSALVAMKAGQSLQTRPHMAIASFTVGSCLLPGVNTLGLAGRGPARRRAKQLNSSP